ncbi:MAG: EamA family transporter RarD [Acidimicrobiales bacterium]|nr:EamA family transporter RarD [Hyphomonadaceae bacterium]RZV43695.1 MAG: EamA family transporter RarD [Acidimicrobiales bacterium]
MTSSPSNSDLKLTDHAGLLAAIAAFVIWGVFPVYFKLTESASALEILAHRIIWSVVFGAVVVQFRKQWSDVKAAVSNRNTLKFLMLATVCIAVNWGFYIWAVQNDLIFQASLGYYINPLFFVVIGTVFLKENLGKYKLLAVIFATIGVAVLTIYGGQFPWVSMILATSWTGYAVIRKQIDVGAMPGLFVETCLLFLPSLAYLAYLYTQGNLELFNGSINMKMMLIAAGPITVIPLLAFTFAAKRLELITLGFLQFIGPTLQFVVGLAYGEALTTAHIICFGFIWSAVALFCYDGWRASRISLA